MASGESGATRAAGEAAAGPVKMNVWVRRCGGAPTSGVGERGGATQHTDRRRDSMRDERNARKRTDGQDERAVFVRCSLCVIWRWAGPTARAAVGRREKKACQERNGTTRASSATRSGGASDARTPTKVCRSCVFVCACFVCVGRRVAVRLRRSVVRAALGEGGRISRCRGGSTQPSQASRSIGATRRLRCRRQCVCARAATSVCVPHVRTRRLVVVCLPCRVVNLVSSGGGGCWRRGRAVVVRSSSGVGRPLVAPLSPLAVRTLAFVSPPLVRVCTACLTSRLRRWSGSSDWARRAERRAQQADGASEPGRPTPAHRTNRHARDTKDARTRREKGSKERDKRKMTGKRTDKPLVAVKRACHHRDGRKCIVR